ncbi:MAG TPA: hypothetical protein PLU36_04730 [Chitinophagaceae bacterium]|nr:hypothetical protein [Chitinophagaceae bacterium]MCC6635463.1 hypothetical protein [Chitinophagaceae bacterium]HMZ46086.1 hypothetical protein [Chitinophagaceae bacterium]HNE92779.1 hypothetical protein [Chitinophagaceae bacterium]HNJ57433.1 hypothetical protein [Chitinophagaceae bacterium]
MKFIYTIIIFCVATTLHAQENEMPIQISAQNSTVKAYFKDNHKPDTLLLKMNKKEEGKLVIMYANTKSENNLKRYFTITDKNNQPLKLFFLSRIVGITHILLNDFFKQAQAGNFYNLYCTISTEDGKETKQFLLCTIKLNK